MKRSFIAIAAAALMLASCATPTKVAYFQDTEANDLILDVQPLQIRLQPEDKISIIVNTENQQLTNLFNLAYTPKYLGMQSDTYQTLQGVSGYTIDANGDIDFPVLGKVIVGGLTREEVAILIKNELVKRNLARTPVVTVDFMNLTISLMGEVSNPGRYAISRDHVTILDAISMAGDLTITGRRDCVKVIREKDGKQQTYTVDLTSIEDVVKSPVYYMQQNDIIYVMPNDMRLRQSTVNGNNIVSTSFWISIASLAATLVSTITVVARK